MAQMRHVVFIGEIGAGKSSVINLFADRECAAISYDLLPCTHDFVSRDVLVDGATYRLWDTPGLGEASGWISRSTRTSSLEAFLRERYRRGELDLLVFCVRGNRATQGMSRAYKTFGRPTRQFGIPVVLAITNLERQQPTMETWWLENERGLWNLGLEFDGHACLTCLAPHNRRWASQQDIRFLISMEYRRRSVSPASDGEYLSSSRWNIFGGSLGQQYTAEQKEDSPADSEHLSVSWRNIFGSPQGQQHTAKQQEDSSDKVLKSLRADPNVQSIKSGEEIESLETTIQQLRTQLSDSQRNAKKFSTELSSSQRKHDEEIKNLEITIQRLRTQLSDSQQNAKKSSAELSNSQRKHGEEIKNLETTIQWLRTQLSDSQQNVQKSSTELSSSQWKHYVEMKNLETTIQQLRTQLSDSQRVIYVHRQKHQCETLYADGHVIDATKSLLDVKRSIIDDVKSDVIIMDWLSVFTTRCVAVLEQIGDTASRTRNDGEALAAYAAALSLSPPSHNTFLNKWASIILLRGSANDVLDGARELKVPKVAVYRATCDVLEGNGRVTEAIECLQEMRSELAQDNDVSNERANWVVDFQGRCTGHLEKLANAAYDSQNYDQADKHYSTILSLDQPDRSHMLIKRSCARAMMKSWEDALKDADEAIKLDVMEAIRFFREMCIELARGNNVGDVRGKWEFDFQGRCTERLEMLAEAACDSQNYDEADRHYSTILSLDQPDRSHTLIKRSHNRAMTRSWEDALKDADEAIEVNPSSYQGYECRHAALHGARRHAEAVSAFDSMLLKLQEPHVRGFRSRYQDARPIIRRIVRATISHMPRVLIDTATGHLWDRTQRAEVFETLPIFNELVSSMTNEVNHAWIRREVKEFYRYVMFSHRWEHGEPLFKEVERVTVYKLEASRGNIKLRTFCSLVRSLGFRWAWSDTCCIDKENNVVLQESLVAMFAWYRGSSLTIIHLLGVSSLSEEPDGVKRSIWNTRVWTYQEYVAAQRVLFYTEDWKPYLGLTLENHKESPVILREMEISQVSSEQVAVLQPGLDRVREKLHLASTRETTLVEDIAYSLFGILNASIPVIYGEGARAVGRLLEHVLTGSGDATILAWTGTASDYNSCLPVNLAVYKTIVPPHIPHMETAELDHAVTELRTSLPDVSLATTLFNELDKLPPPTVASSRLRLPGIVSPITDASMSGPDAQTYHVTTVLFGDIEIQTASGLATLKGLFLVHPWHRPLLDQEFARDSAGVDSTTEALRLIARLQQPFGALLFERVSRTDYRRVAADSLIVVRFREGVSLAELINSIRTIEVL